MKKILINAGCLILILIGSCVKTSDSGQINPELIYHVVLRSFYDSNGDGHGDLKGLHMQLDYLKELGVTAILLLPLYESIYYHNYFASNFESIDSTLGSLADLLTLIEDAHLRGIKVYMDMEIQYITGSHPWFLDAFENPSSEFSSFILWDDSMNQNPSSIVYDITHFQGYDGREELLTTLNLHDEGLQTYFRSLFTFFMDPHGDGSFRGGVDGFRIDHMMDDLDNKGRLTNLLSNFWGPLMDSLRSIKPEIIFMAEQADWTSYGREYLENAGVDRVFAFPLSFAIRALEKSFLVEACHKTFMTNKDNIQQIVFATNHDMHRLASVLDGHPEKLRLAAVLNLCLGGIPAIYYGQELGMKGMTEWERYGLTDGNEIPVREAFEWYADTVGPGRPFWYKNTGPWWNDSQSRPFDGISLEEQKKDQQSLWQFYQSLIHLRKANPALHKGVHIPATDLLPDPIFAFHRVSEEQCVFICMNLSETNYIVEKGEIFQWMDSRLLNQDVSVLITSHPSQAFDSSKSWIMPPYSFVIFDVGMITNPL